ncbi:MAG: ATPase [Rhodothalassiaceae bacterium]|nr:MAG: ATPase [Rhodothalassiaceae bacterium]
MRVAVSWSSGKDSALALHRLRGRREVTIAALVTTVNERRRRVAIHGVREAVLDAQAAALGLPLVKVPLPEPCPNAVYEERFGAALTALAGAGVQAVAFGDIFLADVRAYRERLLARAGLAGLFPLWGEDSAALAAEMIATGIRARISAIQRGRLGVGFLGRRYDEAFLADLPPGVDPCGENGEFHSCVEDMPGFAAPMRLVTGRRVLRGAAAWIDLKPAGP